VTRKAPEYAVNVFPYSDAPPGDIGFRVDRAARDWSITGTARIAPTGIEIVELSITPRSAVNVASERGEIRGLHDLIQLMTETREAPEGGISAEVWKSVRIGEIRRLVRNQIEEAARTEERVQEWMKSGGLQSYDVPRTARSLRARLRDGGGHPGRRGYPELHYRRVAIKYLQLCGANGPRRINQALAEWLGIQLGYEVSNATAASHVHTARQRGFLGPTKPGRANCEPGPRLLEEGPK
jgi:hypothetical protein